MFLSAFLAGTILPFSSEIVLLACIGLGLDPVWSTLFTTAGNALGGFTCYWIGRIGKTEWIEKYFKVDKKQMDKAIRFIHGRGSWMAFSHFFPSSGMLCSSPWDLWEAMYGLPPLPWPLANWLAMPLLWPQLWESSDSSDRKPMQIFLAQKIWLSLRKLPKIIYEKFNKTWKNFFASIAYYAWLHWLVHKT